MIDIPLLRNELSRFLADVLTGDYLARCVAPDARRLVDVAFSGNGEPTSSAQFGDAVECVGEVLEKNGLIGELPIRLITNGSLLDRKKVQCAISMLRGMNGEVWFKLDAATVGGLAEINGTRTRPDLIAGRLAQCVSLAPTWVQTCLFSLDGKSLDDAEFDAYLDLLAPVAGRLEGVHLYGLARPSLQKEAPRLGRLSGSCLEEYGARIAHRLGLTVTVSP